MIRVTPKVTQRDGQNPVHGHRLAVGAVLTDDACDARMNEACTVFPFPAAEPVLHDPDVQRSRTAHWPSIRHRPSRGAPSKAIRRSSRRHAAWQHEERFFNAVGIFDRETSPVYIDDCCHYTLAGNQRLADFVSASILGAAGPWQR